MKSKLAIILSSFLLLLTVTAVADQSGLSDVQLKSLESTGLAVVVPGWIPEGFSVAAVQTRVEGGPGGTGYRIVYTGPRAEGFTVEATSGGIGGVAGDRDIPATCFLGETSVAVFTRDGVTSSFSQWVGEGPRGRGAHSAGSFPGDHGAGHRIPEVSEVESACPDPVTVRNRSLGRRAWVGVELMPMPPQRKPYEPPEIFIHELPEELSIEEFGRRFAAPGKPFEAGDDA